MTNEQVGAWIKARRDAQKLSLKALVESAGISRQTWYDLEKGKYPPSTDTQRGVAQAFGVDVDWYDRLLAGEEPTAAEAVSPLGDDALQGMESRLRAEIAEVDARVRGMQEALQSQLEAMVAPLEALADRLERERRES